MSNYPGGGSLSESEFTDDAPYSYGGGGGGSRGGGGGGGNGNARPFLFAAAVAGLLGAIFAGISTSDFITHLDRQVHSIHCSINPLASASLGDSGCKVVMMSPYSSLFRDSMWGGMPISLLAFAVFFYLIARGLSFGLRDNTSKNETGYLVLAWCLPALMSVIYAIIAKTQVGEWCTLCIGVYVASVGGLVCAVLAHRAAPAGDRDVAQWGIWFGIGCVYVGLMVMLFMMFAPKDDNPAEGCGTLAKRDDPSGIILDLGGKRGGADSLAVIDPLCPACKAFDERMQASGLYDKLKVDAVLFPLDSSCNWMVKEALHPGACLVSQAMLCDADGAVEILDYAFQHQKDLRDMAKQDERKLKQRLEQKFPKVKGCLGSAKAKNRLNKSLRFAVANALPVLTPQLFIEGSRVCDEDTDLGLEYTVTEMLKGSGGKSKRGSR